jgi:hypothetical protein
MKALTIMRRSVSKITTSLKRNGGRIIIGNLAVILVVLSATDSANAQRDWAATLYTGRITDARLGETAIGDFKFEDAYFVSLGLMRRLYTYRHYFNLELEGQVKKFFGDQDYWDFVLIGYIRWLPFPWDRYVETSFAAGAGLSYATSVPAIETKNYDQSARFLGALSFEFTFALPTIPEWSLVAGILHHRSGADGTFSGVRGASNGIGMGVRYKF